MKEKIKKCDSCETYSIGKTCRKCGEKLINPEPPKFSIEDKYGKYRRKEKMKSR